MEYRLLTREIVFSGKGLHTGEDCRATLSPGRSGEGVTVGRGGEAFPLAGCTFSGTGRGTEVFLPGGQSVKTPEHLFAALYGLGIWSVRISAEGPEVPALDGCSAAFAEALLAGSRPVAEGEEQPEPFALSTPIAVEDSARNALVFAFPSGELSLSYVITYEGTPIGTQAADFRLSPGSFGAFLAPSRTFALASEVQSLLDRGLAKGGSPENAVVVGETSVSAAGGLRFPDEFVRHKILDLLGDLYLLGCPLRARVVALRAGHALHCRLAENLLFLSCSRHFPKKETNHV
ncbi:UDP-3-O-acyl-N-acetylglucosamine deacetylase [Aminivibrio sp.]|jgi:UDP-3-O-[3-hydroxymyristoyl] N-acetylglucosamine deacetylase|uniref:UDP-3-O-acyl-N-acetylglucosamine deacetylase n=1 Tax=Aminivibrio sp. TaxID=1872489 RepID=UPI001A47D585|nr:UDP-3-O-acyl-N-acetylglucosamine deacetylase [Aminivibrio sp.]MBL3540403.1 UDP-3-O-acyl-N-acetylglucosamine deacetylase [Aminivibrio sp.]